MVNLYAYGLVTGALPSAVHCRKYVTIQTTYGRTNDTSFHIAVRHESKTVVCLTFCMYVSTYVCMYVMFVYMYVTKYGRVERLSDLN